MLAVPMLADVLAWRARVAAEPVAEPITRILGRLRDALVGLLERWVADAV